MANQPVPEISAEMKNSLIEDRLAQYRVRIFNMQMDIAAYEAVGDVQRQVQAAQNLSELVTSYHAVEAMV